MEELEKPLISLGLCNNRGEVQMIMDQVDEDGSGQIEFNEFLHIIKSASQKKGKATVSQEEEEEAHRPRSTNVSLIVT